MQVDLPYAAMIHDMAITKSSKVIFHFPLSFDPSVRAGCGAALATVCPWTASVPGLSRFSCTYYRPL